MSDKGPERTQSAERVVGQQDLPETYGRKEHAVKSCYVLSERRVKHKQRIFCFSKISQIFYLEKARFECDQVGWGKGLLREWQRFTFTCILVKGQSVKWVGG